MGDLRLVSLCALVSLTPLTAQNVNDRFYDAIRKGDRQAITQLLSGGAEVNARDNRGDTPLMYAAAVGSADAMRQLIAAGADVNAKDSFDATALMWCANNVEKVRLLIEKGADVNAVSKQGKSPLVIAAAHAGNVEAVRLLIEHGADVKAPPTGASAALIAAAQADDDALIKLLLDHGADVKATDPRGFTALIQAAGNGNAAVVKLLLGRGADVNAQSAPESGRGVKNGPIALGSFTPLLLAVTAGSPEAVRLLLDAGADVNARDVRQMTPLMLAVATDHPDEGIVRMLLAKGAATDLKSRADETALDWAAKFRHPAILPLIQKASPGVAVAKREAPAITRASLDVRSAVAKSVELLQKNNVTFLREGGCISCHAQDISSLAVASARARGAHVDEAAAVEVARGTRLQFTAPAGLMLERVDPPAVPILSNALFGLAAERIEPDRITDAMVQNIAARQRTDGSWNNSGIMRPPTADSAITTTAFAIRALRDYFPPAKKVERDERIVRAAKWLMAAKPTTTEDAVAQLLGVRWAGSAGAPVERMIRGVLKLQRQDGGWAQTPYLESDAYATATVLYALKEAGSGTGSDDAYGKGVRYLLSTQAEDGSWYVASRAPKFQPYFDGGFPYGHDGWISQWATGYAVAALSYAIPETRAAK